MKKYTSPLIACILFMLAIAIGVGCASVAKITFGTLESIGIAENGAMRVAADADAKHQITDAQWNQIADAHSKFLPAYDAACNGAAVALDQASVPANVTALEANVINLVATFVQPAK